jgi:hypothetical protein
VYSGFALHPKLSEQEHLRIDDISILVATGRYLKNTGREDYWREIGGESKGFGDIKWARYDPIVRDMMVSLCVDQPLPCAETFLLYKPYYFVDTMLWFYRIRQSSQVAAAFDSIYFGDIGTKQMATVSLELDKRNFSAAPWRNGFLWFGTLVVTGLALARNTSGKSIGILCMLCFSLVSITPSIAGYPAPLGMIDAAVLFTATAQLIAVIMAFLCCKAISSLRRR